MDYLELAKQMYGEDSAEAKRDRLVGGLASATAAHTVAMASLQTVHGETAHEIQQLKQEEAALKQELAAVASADKKTDVQTTRLDEARSADIPRVKYVELWLATSRIVRFVLIYFAAAVHQTFHQPVLQHFSHSLGYRVS
jgi:hypothetical protein